jgi:hypothetical protein
MECLLRVKIWAGDPPVRVLSRRAGLPPSTMQDFLHREHRKLPPVETVCAFLEACGVDNSGVMAEWVFAWRRLKFAETENRRRQAPRGLVSALPAGQLAGVVRYANAPPAHAQFAIRMPAPYPGALIFRAVRDCRTMS